MWLKEQSGIPQVLQVVQFSDGIPGRLRRAPVTEVVPIAKRALSVLVNHCDDGGGVLWILDLTGRLPPERV